MLLPVAAVSLVVVDHARFAAGGPAADGLPLVAALPTQPVQHNRPVVAVPPPGEEVLEERRGVGARRSYK